MVLGNVLFIRKTRVNILRIPIWEIGAGINIKCKIALKFIHENFNFEWESRCK